MLVALLALVGAACVPALAASGFVLRRRRTARERRRRDLRLRLLEAIVEPGDCPVCRTELDPDFRCCPGCGLGLRPALVRVSGA